MTALDRLSVLSGLIRQVRQTQAGATRARIARLEGELADPALTTPPDTATAAQHARWAAARRVALVQDLASARAELANRTTAARIALGVDGAVTRLCAQAAAERQRKARRD